MKKSKIAFMLVSILFILVLLFIVIDFSKKTTFPGFHQQERDSISGYNQRSGS